jgi:hypothetical protein
MRVWQCVIGSSIAFFLQACTAEPMPIGWRTDCVGWLQISLPGEADVAARTLQSWRETLNKHPTDVPLRFPDEQRSFWGAHGLEITHPLEPKSLDEVYIRALRTAESFKADAKNNPHWALDKDSFRSVSAKPLEGASWVSRAEGTNGYSYTGAVIAKVGLHFVKFMAFANDNEDKLASTRVEPELKRFAQDLRYRPLFTVPTVSGLCYPYLFLQDSAGEARKPGVHTTYRLKDHPDINIFLSHGHSPGFVPDRASQREAAERKADSFWRDQYGGNYKSIVSVFKRPGGVYRAVEFAGRDGAESFVEFTREDGTIDWGYLIAAPGSRDPKALVPDLLFYVIRNASVAKAKGKEPFGTEDSFLKFARSIAATVKPFPTAATGK